MVDDLKAAGADVVACVSVADAYVMKAFGVHLGMQAAGIQCLGDPEGLWAKALGIAVDCGPYGMGGAPRNKRFGLVAKDGVIKYFGVEDGGKGFDKTTGTALLMAVEGL